MKAFRFTTSLIAGLATIALMPMSSAVAGDQLTITSYGGAAQIAERKAYYEPFAKKTGVSVTEEEYNGGVAKIRAMVESNTVSWDVVFNDAMYASQMCAEGVLEVIDWGKLGLDRSKLRNGDKDDCGVPESFYATIVAYDKDKLPNGPTTIADLFDLQKFPGKRGLFKDPFVNLEWALIADGVATSDVYKVLSTPEGVDRAFKKLDTIKKDVVWWEAGAQPPQLLADGQVVITQAWNGRISDAIKNSGKNFEIMWDGQALGWNTLIIPKGAPHLEEAYKFIAFAVDPAQQAEKTHYFAGGPANIEATPLVDPKILSSLPTNPENMGNALMVDVEFWADHGDELGQRFTAWLAQ
ncbi:ABC transporter substrate-binding protein [Rhizobium azibense]|uniref:Putative spermidine/putrescine transport system substrate-binding protein n=1 Tax=Rhizobium azibense TaxID=1136135 RepID=A0A4R3R853_9HYPH|nr:ABC transporter substrate-binding protein [Rhizobium azibense]TCU31458.1 putative spermidine/putrescine transport system substrate-binding protein [Rhizobium azibense]